MASSDKMSVLKLARFEMKVFFSVEYRDATEGKVTGRLAERSKGRGGAVPPRQPHPTQIRLQYSCSFSCSGKIEKENLLNFMQMYPFDKTKVTTS